MKVHPPFRFKKFSVAHDRCAMKVGTDAVLLGAWVKVTDAQTILDVGTGSGVIALMLAQRTGETTLVDALEVEKEDAEQAKENFDTSPWASRLRVIQKTLQQFNPDSLYDLIVSNPPYFSNSLLPPSADRTRTRHTHHLTFEELIQHSIRLLKPNGRLAVVLPYQEGLNFKQIAHDLGLHLHRQLAFFSRKGKQQERWLFEFGFEKQLLHEETLTLYDDGDTKSEKYILLTADFYLR